MGSVSSESALTPAFLNSGQTKMKDIGRKGEEGGDREVRR